MVGADINHAQKQIVIAGRHDEAIFPKIDCFS
jgi:hypothetical protein